jgi:hypothetical protein
MTESYLEEPKYNCRGKHRMIKDWKFEVNSKLNILNIPPEIPPNRH